MSNPKFSVGERVAICTPGLQLVIPDTVITDRWFLDDEIYIIWPTLAAIRYSGWVYTFVGHHKPTREQNIRPYAPGEYTEDTQDIHKPVEVDA